MRSMTDEGAANPSTLKKSQGPHPSASGAHPLPQAGEGIHAAPQTHAAAFAVSSASCGCANGSAGAPIQALLPGMDSPFITTVNGPSRA